MTIASLVSQTGRMLWARKLLIGISFASTLTGAVWVIETSPPRYTATARVQLNALQNSTGSGRRLDENFAKAYVNTQVQLIRDSQVAVRVVDELGWANSPELAEDYAGRGGDGDGDLRRWLGERIVSATRVNLPPDSNVLEIKYMALDRNQAVAIAESIRRAFIQVGADSAQDAARRDVKWQIAQADKVKIALQEMEAAKARYERETGVVLQERSADVDTARLGALATRSNAPLEERTVSASAAALQLNEIDTRLAQMSLTLGARHPALLDLQRRRAVLAEIARRDSVTAASGLSAMNSADHQSVAMIDAQRAKVVSQRTQLGVLNQTQDRIQLLREQYNNAMSRAMDLQQVAAAGHQDLSPVGPADVPDRPDFPNKPLIVVGASLLGLASGILLALLMELMERRIRSIDDLKAASTIPVIGRIPDLGRRAEAAPSKPRRASPRPARQKPRRLKSAKAAESA